MGIFKNIVGNNSYFLVINTTISSEVGKSYAAIFAQFAAVKTELVTIENFGIGCYASYGGTIRCPNNTYTAVTTQTIPAASGTLGSDGGMVTKSNV